MLIDQGLALAEDSRHGAKREIEVLEDQELVERLQVSVYGFLRTVDPTGDFLCRHARKGHFDDDLFAG